MEDESTMPSMIANWLRISALVSACAASPAQAVVEPLYRQQWF